MQSGFLLDVVVRKGAAIFELLAGEDQALLIRRNTLLILNLGLNVVDRVRGFDFQSNGLSSQGLNEDLHTTTEAEHQVEGRLLLNVVVRERTAILKLLSSEDEALLVRRDALLVLDLGLHIVDGVGRLNLEGDGLSGKGLHEDLHTSTKAQDQVKGRLLLDVVVGQSTTVLELLASEDQALLVRGNALLVLDLALDVVDGIRGLDLEGDGLAGDCKRC
jgi:hypothetical protein